jgi:hypothetical protein
MFTDSNSNPLPGIVITIIVIVSIVIILSGPDWIIVIISAAVILWQSVITFRYFAKKFIAGALQTRIPNKRSFSRALFSTICIIIAGILRFVEPPKALSIIKIYSFEILLIAFAIFSVIAVFRHTEIRKNGILHENGGFYHWKNIESFDWAGIDDTLSIKLRNFLLWNNAKISVSPVYKKEITDSFAKYSRDNYD